MKKRILYIDIIKVLAILFVIFNHSDDILISSRMHVRIIHNSLFYLSKSAVPLFFMTSGILIMEKKDTALKLLKRIIRVIIPLIVITIIWTLTHAKSFDFIKMINPFEADYFPYWLWFLQAILVIYILLPLIRKITLKNINKNTFRKIIIISTTLFSILFTIYNIIYKKNMTIITNFIPMPILYFMYGYILSKEKNNRLVKNISIFFLIVAISIPTYIATCLMLQKQSYFFLDDYRNIYTFIITTALFIIVKYCFENFKKENVFTKIINHLSNNSYGIYLIHVFILEYILNTPLIKELSGFHKLEAISIVIISTLIISDIIITILKRIPGIKKIL